MVESQYAALPIGDQSESESPNPRSSVSTGSERDGAEDSNGRSIIDFTQSTSSSSSLSLVGPESLEPASKPDAAGLLDLTQGSLVWTIVRLAIPSVLQAVLSNCYAFNDFIFVGHIPNVEQSSAATAALSATVGLQVIAFSIHNCIPAGANTYSAQYKGAKDTVQLAKTFQAAFYACIAMSSLVAVLGSTNIHSIALLCNANQQVTHAIELYFGTLLASSPAFGLMLLVDGFYKSCGDTGKKVYDTVLIVNHI